MATTVDPRPAAGWRTPLIVILAGCLIAMVGFGVRSVFGLFLEPMTLAHGWSRETFGLAMAIQNLLWGIGVPVAGALADRYGSPRVLAVGAVLYALGVWGMADSDSASLLHLSGGVLTGLGIAFTSFSLALAAMAKVVGPQRRSFALGLGTAAGSFGQIVFSPLGQAFIVEYGWHTALLLLAASTLVIIPLAFVLPSTTSAAGESHFEQTLGQALREATGHRGFVLLTLGFFVCGFHVAFITVHFPAYIKDLGLPGTVAAGAIALIGACNILGSFGSGAFGQRWSKRYGLSAIYFLRAIAITGLMLAPKTALAIYLFSAVMGVLWLSTVPLTTGIVGQVFGVRYMATLFGIVFLSHQLGSFSGVWLGGYLYDTTGSYDPVWWAGVGFGLLAAVVHLPIDETPLARLAPARS
ncbi:Predicted arabinose efflux permease, MFS family [Tistlia consotensis]|uniref:Predicted arabinose efflux permease, MFS family n=1 Tax=Tistlia consotensis USBA 355 TaxID=560819 RepID=A0A1Y6BF69_9PROT|nr:MFS transporter [Tistlia consotensis]SME98293.1 Predicted arabinose efflux permease, MFS family [Tistlia consotensis USBA 355]SNR57604.1 Predicted arabinose efflux permease, MFS family [Tistlia consotensis]